MVTLLKQGVNEISQHRTSNAPRSFPSSAKHHPACESNKKLVTNRCKTLHLRRVDYTYGDFRARREASVWQRLNRIILVLLVIAIWLVIVTLFVPPYKKLMQSRREIDDLQQRVNEQQGFLARLTREVNLLRTDVTYLESIARDRLDLMKEGETIFRLEEGRAKPKPNDSARK